MAEKGRVLFVNTKKGISDLREGKLVYIYGNASLNSQYVLFWIKDILKDYNMSCSSEESENISDGIDTILNFTENAIRYMLIVDSKTDTEIFFFATESKDMKKEEKAVSTFILSMMTLKFKSVFSILEERLITTVTTVDDCDGRKVFKNKHGEYRVHICKKGDTRTQILGKKKKRR